MPTTIVSRPVIDRMLRNLQSIKEELEMIDLEPSHASNNIPIYIVCRERMRMAKEDLRELRTALNIDEQLTAMGGALMSDTTRDTVLSLCPHEIRCAYVLITAAKARILDLSSLKLNDQQGIADHLAQLEAYLSKGGVLVAEIKRKMGVEG